MGADDVSCSGTLMSATSAAQSFGLLGLLLPPQNRRKLQLLLKFMRRLASKQGLNHLSSDPSYNLQSAVESAAAAKKSLRSFVLDTFTEVIINPGELDNMTTHDVAMSRKIVAFFMDNYDQVWTPPTILRKEVEERVYQSLVSKRLEAGEDPYPITFCRRVPSRVYESEKATALEGAMLDLLQTILSDGKMSAKEKRKKIIKFKESHPSVYYRRFPTESSEPDYMQQQSTTTTTPSSKKSSSLSYKLRSAMRI